jgi:uridine monophosphate synthetase
MTSHPSGSSMTTLYTACAGAALTLTLALAYEAGRRSTSSLPGGSAGGGGAAGRKVGRIGAPFSSLPGEGFFDKLNARAKAINSLLCVGLDPHMKQLDDKTAKGALNFCKALVDATKDVALAYKPNAAFFEVFGEEGAAALKDLVQYVPADIPVLLDGKRGDIGTTAEAYAAAAFEDLGVEAVTVNAYMGRDTVEPFIKDASRGTFVLCKTSNPSSKEVQSLQVSGEGVAVFERLASLASDWNVRHNIGLVVGATDADALRRARAAAPQLWILAPGMHIVSRLPLE